jgi:tetratricopeptide (TPR) repeat protein
LRNAEELGTDSELDGIFGALSLAYAEAGNFKESQAALNKYSDTFPLTRIQLYAEISKVSKSRKFSLHILQSATKVAGSCRDSSEERNCWLSWLTLAKAYSDIDRLDIALALAHRPLADTNFTIAEIAKVRALNKDTSGAQQALRNFPAHSDWDPSYQDALEAIAIGAARTGDYVMSQEVVKKIPNDYLKFTVIIAAAAETPKNPVILEWLDLAMKINSDGLQGPPMQALMAALARENDLEIAEKWLSANDPNLKPFARAKSKLGIAQGMLGQIPGRTWIKSLFNY